MYLGRTGTRTRQTARYMKRTSESLLLRLQNSKDQQAWSKFVHLYTPLLFHWARKTGLQQNDSADLVQEVLTIVFRKLPDFQYDASKSFRAWLKTITINKFREFCRRRTVSRNALTGSFVDRVHSSNDDPESTWDISYQRSLFANAMEILKPEFRPKTWEAVKEYVVENRPAAELAKKHELSVWTIYAAKSRLLARLREELDGLLD